MVRARQPGGLRLLRARLALAAGLACLPAASATALDFLHIEANEGGSSGGHVALRFGDATYHFQNVDGLLLLVRDDSQRFLHDYALLENRPIHVRRIELAADAERSARERFQKRLEAQRSQQGALDAIRAERALLARLLARERGATDASEPISIPGAGYFEPGGRDAPQDPALRALRARAVRRHGDGLFARLRASLRAELADLRPEPPRAPSAPLDAFTRLPYEYGFAARAADLVAAGIALDVLDGARPLRPDALRRSDSPALRLGLEDRRALRGLAGRLRGAALHLLEGKRPDWGPALLVAMARLAAAEQSLRDGRLLVLDAYPDAAPALGRRTVEHQRALLPAMAFETGAVAREALQAFASGRASQAAWADVEDATNRHVEVLGAWREGRALRAAPDRLVPARRAWVHAPDAIAPSPDALERALAAAAERERWLEGELERVHGYHLLAYNCVSELFATLNGAFGDPSLATVALGGEVDGRSRLAFIPFVSARQVQERYRVAQEFTVPSLRRARVERAVAREGAVARLRESSPLTTRALRPGSRDSLFLFYTDDVVWPRPLLGALNLAVGAGGSVAGLLAAPLDGGRTLLRGLRGALMSLPELAFVNLRKGTTDWVPRDTWHELAVGHAWAAAPAVAREARGPAR